MTREPVALTCGEPASWLRIGASCLASASRRNGVLLDRRPQTPSQVGYFRQRWKSWLFFDKGCNATWAACSPPFPKANVYGQPDLENAQAVIDVIKQGVRQVRKGQASALCTLPIHKQILQDGARFPFPGHTEFLASLCDVETAVMMLASPSLKMRSCPDIHMHRSAEESVPSPHIRAS